MATYYVDFTAGNDGNTGLSQLQAWKTLNKVNTSAFNPGDQILLKRGEEWNNDQLVFPSSGTSGNEIIIDCYGTSSDPLPIISLDITLGGWGLVGGSIYSTVANTLNNLSIRSSPGWGPVWESDTPGWNQYYLMGFAGAGDIVASGQMSFVEATNTLFIRCFDDANPATHTIKTITLEVAANDEMVSLFDNIDYVTMQNINLKYSFRQCVHITNTSTYINVNNCIVEYSDKSGIALTNQDCMNCIITENIINDVNVGIFLDDGTDNCIISHNVINRTKEDSMGIGNFDVANFCDGNIFEYNTSLNSDESGIDIKYGKNTIFRYNRIIDAGQGSVGDRDGIYFNGEADPDLAVGNRAYGNYIENPVRHGLTIFTKDSEVYYNVINQYGSGGAGYGIAISGSPTFSADNCLIYNNTFVPHSTTPSGRDIVYIGDGATGVVIKNNIFFRNGGGEHVLEFQTAGDVANCTLDYNCCYSTTNNTIYRASGVSYTRAAFFVIFGEEKHSIQTDPLIENIGSGNFHLRSDSPCMDTGTNVGLTADHTGFTVPSGIGVDIGAHEYNTAFLRVMTEGITSYNIHQGLSVSYPASAILRKRKAQRAMSQFRRVKRRKK